jgi:cyclic pyranopterin phosphate synthase
MADRTSAANAGARMIDVGAKRPTRREAVARGRVALGARARRLLAAGELPKGDPREIARVAGIMAAKATPSLIPLCHTIELDSVEVDLAPTTEGVEIESRVRARARTGVEMEALAAVAAAALTVYDMCKAVDRGAVIGEIKLVEKSGGRSGRWRAE